MVGRHLPSGGGGSRRGETPTVHTQAAKHLSKRLGGGCRRPEGSKSSGPTSGRAILVHPMLANSSERMQLEAHRCCLDSCK